MEKSKACKRFAGITLLLLSLAAAACSAAKEGRKTSPEAEVILRFACESPRGHPSTEAAASFADTVEKASGGRLRVKLYDSGRLGDDASVAEQVRFGGIDLAVVALGAVADYSKTAAEIDLPRFPAGGTARPRPSLGSVEMVEELGKEKLLLLGRYLGGFDYFVSAGKRLSSPEDLRGMKIGLRSSPGRMRFIADLGAIPIPLKPGEIQEALKKGYIEGALENLLVFHAGKHYETAGFLLEEPAVPAPDLVIGSRTVLTQLPKQDRDILESAASISASVQLNLWGEREREVLRELKRSGVVLSGRRGNP